MIRTLAQGVAPLVREAGSLLYRSIPGNAYLAEAANRALPSVPLTGVPEGVGGLTAMTDPLSYAGSENLTAMKFRALRQARPDLPDATLLAVIETNPRLSADQLIRVVQVQRFFKPQAEMESLSDTLRGRPFQPLGTPRSLVPGPRSDDLDRARGMTASAVPLAEFIQRHLPGSPEAMPTDPNMGRTVQTPAGTQSLDRIIEEGSQAILKAMERDAAGWPEGTRAFMPDTLTDAQPIHQQIETAPEEFPETFYSDLVVPRPGEPVTPRERRVLEETLGAEERGRRSFVIPEAT